MSDAKQVHEQATAQSSDESLSEDSLESVSGGMSLIYNAPIIPIRIPLPTPTNPDPDAMPILIDSTPLLG